MRFISRIAELNSSLGRYCARLMDEANPYITTEHEIPLARVEAGLVQVLRDLVETIGAKSTHGRQLSHGPTRTVITVEGTANVRE